MSIGVWFFEAGRTSTHTPTKRYNDFDMADSYIVPDLDYGDKEPVVKKEMAECSQNEKKSVVTDAPKKRAVYRGASVISATPKEKAIKEEKPVTVIDNTMGLSDEQQAVLEEVKKGNSVVIDSVIGSGKTRTLQAICDYFSSLKILYLTYNTLLKLDAQKKITNRNVTVQNYHGFVYRYLIRKGLNVEPNKQIKTFLEKCPDIPIHYDLICIDEYQDLEEDSVNLLLYLAKICPKAQWVFVGDMSQTIYDKTQVDVYEDCLNKIIPQYIPMALTKSFRISDLHATFLSSLWGKYIVGVNPNCSVVKTDNFDRVLEVIDGAKNEDVLILGPRYGFTQELVNILEKHDSKKYNKNTVWTSIKDRDENFTINPNSLIVTTYDGCKGMERPICIVIDWTNNHFKNRVTKPYVNSNIIRNLFCVAASRGKDKIIFYENPNAIDAHLLTQRDMENAYVQVEMIYEPNSMFSFKHQVDIDACMEDVIVEEIPQDDTTPIDVVKADGNIDLTPAVGIYQEITFFKKWDFMRKWESLKDSPIKDKVGRWIKRQKSFTDEKRALALSAYSTELYRYCNQATSKFISKKEHDRLLERIGTHLDANSDNIQVKASYRSKIKVTGFMDYVDEDRIPWELKFVSTLTNEHILQTAMYSVMYNSPYAYLWNTRTNDLRKISVKEKKRSLKNVYNCVTMGRELAIGYWE